MITSERSFALRNAAAALFAMTASLTFLLTCAVVSTAHAQDPASQAAQLKVRFRSFDTNKNSVLSGRELDECRCRAYDTDRNGDVKWEEYRDGTERSGARGGAAASAPATSTPRTAATDRNANSAGVYSVPDRVEVNYGGTWYPGNILAAKDGKYQVMRDEYSPDFAWLDPSLIRPLAYKTATRAVPRTALPRSIPAGVYSCWTLSAGFSSSNPSGIAMGDLRITGPGTYTGLKREGVGPAGRFAFNSATGIISWEGNIVAGFSGIPTESSFDLDAQGLPMINIDYRVREGGNLFNLVCRRS